MAFSGRTWWPLIFLMSLLLFSCAHAKENKDPSKKSHAKATEQKETLPKLPLFFGADFNGHPQELQRKLSALGFQKKEWELNAPYTRMVYVQEDRQAVFDRVDILVCNHPARIAAIRIRGHDRNTFYHAVRERFGLGIESLGKDRYEFYTRFVKNFADNTRLVLDGNRRTQELRIESKSMMDTCRKSLLTDLTELQHQKKTEDETLRLRHRDAF